MQPRSLSEVSVQLSATRKEAIAGQTDRLTDCGYRAGGAKGPSSCRILVLLVEELMLLRASCIIPTIRPYGLQLGKLRHELFSNVPKLVSAGGDSKPRLAGSGVHVLVTHDRLGQKANSHQLCRKEFP